MENKLNWEGPFIPTQDSQRFINYFKAETPLGIIRINFIYDHTDYSIENKRIIALKIEAHRFLDQSINIECNLDEAKSIAENWLASKYSELSQIFNTKPMLQAAALMHQVLINRYCNFAKENVGKTPKEIPGCVKTNEAMEVLEEIFPELKFKE